MALLVLIGLGVTALLAMREQDSGLMRDAAIAEPPRDSFDNAAQAVGTR